jgi:hypothetical protein
LCAFCARSRQRNQPKSPKSVQFHSENCAWLPYQKPPLANGEFESA